MKKLLCVLLVISTMSSVFSAGQYHKTYNNYTGDWADAPSWENGDGSLSNNDSIHIYGYIDRNTNLTLNNNIILRVYDTLVVYGDLYIENNGFLYVEAGGIVIVYGDVTADNNVNVDLSSYFITLGDFTQNNNSNIDAPENDTLLYVTGTTTCNMATCLDDSLVGGMDELMDNPDISDLVLGTSSIILPINPTICDGSSVNLRIRDDGTSYQWYRDGGVISGATSYTYAATLAGEYDVTFDVDGNPQDPDPDTVTVVALPTPTLSSDDADNIICAGDQVIFTAGGGTNYEFKLNYTTVQNGAGTTYTTTGLNDGDAVKVVVTNANSCVDSTAAITTTVNALPAPTLSSDDADNIICAGDQVIFTGGGGTNYEFKLNGTTVQNGASTTYTTTGLSDGDGVKVIVTNANSCVDSTAAITTTVNALPAPTLSSDDADNIICAGDQVIFTAGGGTNYKFKLNGTTVQNGAGTTYTTTSLNDGDAVKVVVTNANNCIDSTAAITTTVNLVPFITNPGDQISCGDYTLPVINGTNLSGSEAYYTGPGGTGDSYIAGELILGSETPMYIYDSNLGCIDEVSFNITITNTPSINNPGNQVACDGFTLPTITGNNLTGSESYYTGPNGTGTSYAAGTLISSSVTPMYIYDINGSCSDEVSFNISIVNTVSLDNPGNQVACDSLILPTITGTNLTGSEAYYTGPGGTGISYSAGDVIVNSVSPMYIYIADGSCTDEVSFNITITNTPSIDNPGNQVACDSLILPTITGTNLTGSEAYYTGPGGTGISYSAGDVIVNSVSPMYIYIADGSCTDEVSFNITITNTPSIDNPGNQVACDSLILPTITGTNLTGSEAYYTGSNGTGSSYAAGDVITSSITPLYIYIDNGSCTDEVSFDITITNTPSINNPGNQVACDSYTLPDITGTNLTGSEAYYSGPDGTGTSYSSNESITTSMTLYIYDVNGSCSNEESFSITILSTPNVYDIEDQDICDSYILPVISGENLTGNELYYSISGGAGDVYNVGEVITSTTTLYIYDENGSCNDEESFTITLRDIEVNLEENIEICEGESYTFTTDISFSTYEWNDISNEAEYTTGQAGYVWVIVTNEYLCTASDTVYLTVNNNPIVNIGNDTVICGDESLIIDAGEFILYEWSTGDISRSIQVYAGEQEISVTVADENGCTDRDTILISDCEGAILGDITNVFTPNGDGEHDTWIINGIEMFSDAKIEVFDRSQRRVFFKSGNYSNSDAWDGKFKGKELPMDNYYYVIDLYGDGEKMLKGYVTILR